MLIRLRNTRSKSYFIVLFSYIAVCGQVDSESGVRSISVSISTANFRTTFPRPEQPGTATATATYVSGTQMWVRTNATENDKN